MEVAGKSIIEVRVITHVPNPPTARVALIFSDGTTSAYLKEFPTADAADQFAAGMREALSWQDASVHREPDQLRDALWWLK